VHIFIIIYIISFQFYCTSSIVPITPFFRMSTFKNLEFREGYAGGCIVNGKLTCVAQPQDNCDEGTYVPAHYIRANTGHPLRYCAGDLESVIIGRCGSGKCTNLQSRCVDNDANNGANDGGNNVVKAECVDDDCNGASDNGGRSLLQFIEYDPTCTITQDLKTYEYVTYGKCGNRCVWSKEDCLEGEEYIVNDDTCTADKVQLGACFGGHAYCSVSQASCTQPGRNDEPYMTHQEVQEKIGANCFLSSLPAPPTPAPPPSTPTESPVMTSGFAVFDEDGNTILVSSSSNNNNGGDGGLQMGALVAIVAVVAVLVGAVIGVVSVRLSSKRKEQIAKDNAWKLDKTKKHTLPIMDFEMSTSQGMDDVCAESELSVEIIE
jgi:hypothetical protein